MPTKLELLDCGIEVLRRSEPFTIDAVAREAGLTKPGVMHHFPTKEALLVAGVQKIVDRWVRELESLTSKDSTPVERLRAYVKHAVTGSFDPSDLALLADVRLRALLSSQWAERLDPWLGTEVAGTPQQRASLRAARLLADGAWFNKALGIEAYTADESDDLSSLAMTLVTAGDPT